MKLTPLRNPLHRNRRFRPGLLYGCCSCCCSCCCLLAPIGNYLAVCSSHAHAGKDASFWVHLLLNIVSFVAPPFAIGLTGVAWPMLYTVFSPVTLLGVWAVATMGIMTLTQPVWISPDVSPDRRFSIVLGEWFWSVLLVIGFSVTSVVVFGFLILR